MNIYLDGKFMDTKDFANRYILSKFNINNFIISHISELKPFFINRNSELNIIILNEESLKINLGEYGLEILEFFLDMEGLNKNIKINKLV